METIETSLTDKSLNSKFEKSTESDIIISILKSAITKWWLFLIIGIIAAIGGFVYASLQKPVYQSYLSFALDEGGSEGGGMSTAMGLAAQFGISLGGAQDVFTGDNILQIMQSRRLIEDVLLSVDTFNNKPYTLIEYYRQNQGDKKIKRPEIHFYPAQQRSSFTYAQDSVLYNTFLAFKKYYIIARRPNKNLNIYELMVSSPNEKFSKIFTDKLIEKTNLFYTDIRSKKAKETLTILEKALPTVKGKLDATITNKASTEDANLNTAFANAQVPLLKEQINTQVYGSAYTELYKNLEMARFQYLKSIPLMQIIDAANYPMKKIQPSKLITMVIFAAIGCFIFLILFIIILLIQPKKSL
jgi:hypothetical protein